MANELNRQDKDKTELNSQWISQHIPRTESTQLNSRAQGEMLHTTEQKLYHFYSPYNVELEQILGRPTNWEKQYND